MHFDVDCASHVGTGVGRQVGSRVGHGGVGQCAGAVHQIKVSQILDGGVASHDDGVSRRQVDTCCCIHRLDVSHVASDLGHARGVVGSRRMRIQCEQFCSGALTGHGKAPGVARLELKQVANKGLRQLRFSQRCTSAIGDRTYVAHHGGSYHAGSGSGNGVGLSEVGITRHCHSSSASDFVLSSSCCQIGSRIQQGVGAIIDEHRGTVGSTSHNSGGTRIKHCSVLRGSQASHRHIKLSSRYRAIQQSVNTIVHGDGVTIGCTINDGVGTHVGHSSRLGRSQSFRGYIAQRSGSQRSIAQCVRGCAAEQIDVTGLQGSEIGQGVKQGVLNIPLAGVNFSSIEGQRDQSIDCNLQRGCLVNREHTKVSYRRDFKVKGGRQCVGVVCGQCSLKTQCYTSTKIDRLIPHNRSNHHTCLVDAIGQVMRDRIKIGRLKSTDHLCVCPHNFRLSHLQSSQLGRKVVADIEAV